MKIPRRSWLLFITAMVLGALAVVYLAGRYPDAVDGEGKINLVYGVLLLAVLGGSAILNRRRIQPGLIIYGILGWAALGGLSLIRLAHGKRGDQKFKEGMATTFCPWEDAVLAGLDRGDSRDVVFPVSVFNPKITKKTFRLYPANQWGCARYFLRHGKNGYRTFSRPAPETFGMHHCSGTWLSGS